MPRFTLGRTSRLAMLLVAAVLGLSVAASASADTPPGRGPTPTPTPTPAGRCAVLHVQLNGDRPATHTCVAPAPAGQGTDPSAPSAAFAGSVSCGPDILTLYWDKYYWGPKICFSGSGIANLGDYSPQWYTPWLSWSDKMSSFRTGPQYVNFYEHSNAQGAKLRYASYQSRSSMPDGWNDRVSSLCIWAAHFSCP